MVTFQHGIQLKSHLFITCFLVHHRSMATYPDGTQERLYPCIPCSMVHPLLTDIFRIGIQAK